MKRKIVCNMSRLNVTKKSKYTMETIYKSNQILFTHYIFRFVTIEWDDKESYTCGWLLSEFIRRTNDLLPGETTIAIRSRGG